LCEVGRVREVEAEVVVLRIEAARDDVVRALAIYGETGIFVLADDIRREIIVIRRRSEHNAGSCNDEARLEDAELAVRRVGYASVIVAGADRELVAEAEQTRLVCRLQSKAPALRVLRSAVDGAVKFVVI